MRLKGSFTVEAALIFPLILGVLLTVLYLSFYLHDRAVLDNAAWKLAFDASMYSASGITREKAENKLEERLDNMEIPTLVIRDIEKEYTFNRQKVSVKLNGYFQIPGIRLLTELTGVKEIYIHVNRTASVYNPTEFIRTMKKLEGIGGFGDGTDNQ